MDSHSDNKLSTIDAAKYDGIVLTLDIHVYRLPFIASAARLL